MFDDLEPFIEQLSDGNLTVLIRKNHLGGNKSA
jgi:hypothetical protein